MPLRLSEVERASRLVHFGYAGESTQVPSCINSIQDKRKSLHVAEILYLQAAISRNAPSIQSPQTIAADIVLLRVT